MSNDSRSYVTESSGASTKSERPPRQSRRRWLWHTNRSMTAPLGVTYLGKNPANFNRTLWRNCLCFLFGSVYAESSSTESIQTIICWSTTVETDFILHWISGTAKNVNDVRSEVLTERNGFAWMGRLRQWRNECRSLWLEGWTQRNFLTKANF